MTVAVIGAGASGMMAALTAAEQPENKILLFERQARVGRKLAVTGNGRCNLTNTGAAPENYHGAQPDFAAAFSEAVRRAGMSAIHVCMFVTVFSVLSGYLRLAAGAHLPADAAPLALGALELSAGCAALRACTLAPVWKLCIASFLLSFGGLSILAQSRAAAADAGLEGRQLPGCKMLQGAIAAALTLLLAPLAQAGRWCAPTLGASTMTETAGPVMLLLSSVLLLYFRKKYHSILREGRV